MARAKCCDRPGSPICRTPRAVANGWGASRRDSSWRLFSAFAYLQPATRAEISRLAGREISRDVIASLKRHGLIDGALRAPDPGAPFAKKVPRGLRPRDASRPPDIEKLQDEGLARRPQLEAKLDAPWDLSGTTVKPSRASLNSKAPSSRTRPLIYSDASDYFDFVARLSRGRKPGCSIRAIFNFELYSMKPARGLAIVVA